MTVEKLVAVLERSRQLGFLGPGPVEDHVAHAEVFGRALDEVRSRSGPGPGGGGSGLVVGVDLGAGGGVPSLPLLVSRPWLSLVLVDSSRRRTAFCVSALVELEALDRATVWTGRAETFAHDPAHRDRYQVVVARGFGPPADTVECAAPLLAPGGRCVISEPPRGRDWPAEALASVGMVEVEGGSGVAMLERVGPVGPDHPRAAKHRQRAPLW